MCGVGRKKTKQASQRGTCQHSMPASHMEYSRAHNQHHMAGSLATTYFLQNQAGSRCMCGVGRKKTKQASQRGTCQHSMPASHMEYSRAHNQHHMAGSLATTYFLQNQAGSRCMCGVGRKKTKQASQRGTCQHSMPASHMEYSRAHNQHHMAGSLATTYFLQNQAGSRCMCGVGRKKTKQAGQRGTCQHSRPASHIWATRAQNIHHMAGQEHTSAHRGHTTSTTWQAASRSLTRCRNRRDPDACVG